MSNLQRKAYKIRAQIRRSCLQSNFAKIRQQLLASLDTTDYSILKNININQVLAQFSFFKIQELTQRWNIFQKTISDMFSYTISKQSDHFFEIIHSNERIKLIELISLNHIDKYVKNPRTYIKIIWIISKLMEYYIELADICLKQFQLLAQTFINQEHNNQKISFFSQSQCKNIKQIILSTVNFIYQKNIMIYKVFKKDSYQYKFIKLTIKNFKNIFKQLKNNENAYSQIDFLYLNATIGFFKQIIKHNNYPQKSTIIIQLLLQFVNYFSLQVNSQIIDALRIIKYFYQRCPEQICNVQTNYQLLTKNFTTNANFILKTFKDLQTYQRKSQNQQGLLNYSQIQKRLINQLSIITQYISIFKAIFQQRDQEDQNCIQILQFNIFKDICQYLSYFLNISYPVFNSVIQICLYLISQACLTETILQIIIQDCNILNKIIYFAFSQQSSINIKKHSIYSLTNIIMLIIGQNVESKGYYLQKININSLIQIFANNLANFVQEQINLQMLKAIKLIFQMQKQEWNSQQSCQYFNEIGGKNKLYKLSDTQIFKSRDIRCLAQQIIYKYQNSY